MTLDEIQKQEILNKNLFLTSIILNLEGPSCIKLTSAFLLPALLDWYEKTRGDFGRPLCIANETKFPDA